MNSQARICVIDDEPAVLRAMVRLLESFGLSVSGVESPQKFIENGLADEFDCVVTDFSMPGMNGLELQHAMSHENSKCRVVFVSGRSDVSVCATAMKAGAVDFLTKPVDEDDLFAAVTNALSKTRAERSEQDRYTCVQQRFNQLTGREKQVLQGVIDGFLNKQIAAKLGTAEKTIKVQRASMMKKMQAESVADLVKMSAKLFH